MRRRNVGWVIYFAAALLVNLLLLIVYLSDRTTDRFLLGAANDPTRPTQQDHSFTEAERRIAAKEMERLRAQESEQPRKAAEAAERRAAEEARRRKAAEDEAARLVLERTLKERGLTEERTSQETMAVSLPDFPWPPPVASAWAEIPSELLVAGAAVRTFGDIHRRLGRALDAAGYRQRSLFAVPAGFAIVTQLERIDDDGVPADSSRWQVTESPTTFSLIAYIKRLLHAEPGRYRLVVLVISNVPFSATGGFITASEASRVVSRGLNALPEARATKKYEASHVVTALIYEFRKVLAGEPEFVAPSALPGYEHLVRAKIWTWLSDTQKN